MSQYNSEGELNIFLFNNVRSSIFQFTHLLNPSWPMFLTMKLRKHFWCIPNGSLHVPVNVKHQPLEVWLGHLDSGRKSPGWTLQNRLQTLWMVWRIPPSTACFHSDYPPDEYSMDTPVEHQNWYNIFLRIIEMIILYYNLRVKWRKRSQCALF